MSGPGQAKKPDVRAGDTSMLPVYVFFALTVVATYVLFLFFVQGKSGSRPRLTSSENYAARDGKQEPSSGKKDGKSLSTAGSRAKKAECNKMKVLIEKEAKNLQGTVGIIFHDFESGCHVEINPEEVFESASLVKVPIMIETYRKMARGDTSLYHEIVLQDYHKVGGAGILKNKPAESRWTVKKLLELMITESDNTATDMLIELVGMDPVNRCCREMGLHHTTLHRKIYDFDRIDEGKDNLTSPRDMYKIFRMLYDGSWISKAHREEILGILKRQKRNTMIPRYLPREISCAHKTGGLIGIIHDCGIVYPRGRKPYILILMSRDVKDQARGENGFATMSKKIFEQVEGTGKKKTGAL
jgi:beta-lactamase class A